MKLTLSQEMILEKWRKNWFDNANIFMSKSKRMLERQNSWFLEWLSVRHRGKNDLFHVREVAKIFLLEEMWNWFTFTTSDTQFIINVLV